MNGTVEIILKIGAIILSFTGLFCLAVVCARSALKLRPAEEDDKDKIYSFLLIDVNKTGENTDIFVARINKDINSGKADYIHKILLLDGADIGGFIEEIGSNPGANQNGNEIEKMCGIITEKYDNILYLKK